MTGDRSRDIANVRRAAGSDVEPFSTVDRLGSLTEAEELQREYETTRLIELVARAEMHREDSPFYTNERFAAWLARDLRERAEMSRSGMAMLDRITARVQVRLFGMQLGVADGKRIPAARPTPPVTSIEELLTTAAMQKCAPRWDLSVAAGGGRELWEESCEGLIAIPPEIPPGRYVALRVSGDSMIPLFHSGDLVLVKLGRDLVRDRVIVMRTPDEGYVVKQVGQLTQRHVELRSLNEAYAPFRVPRDPSRVLGTVVMRWCDHEGAAGSSQRR